MSTLTQVTIYSINRWSKDQGLTKVRQKSNLNFQVAVLFTQSKMNRNVNNFYHHADLNDTDTQITSTRCYNKFYDISSDI